MIFISKKAADNYFEGEKCSFIKDGSEGRCFRMPNGDVAKLYDHPRWLLHSNCQELLQFKDIDIKSFIFIQDLIYYPIKIYGTIMPFAPGALLLDYHIECEDIDTMIIALENLIQDIDSLSEEKIMVGDDVSSINTLFDGKAFYFIDTADYEQETLVDKSRVKEYNMMTIMVMIYRLLFANYHVYNFVRKICGIDELGDVDFIFQNPRELLCYIRSKLQDYLEQDFKSFQEADFLIGNKMHGGR